MSVISSFQRTCVSTWKVNKTQPRNKPDHPRIIHRQQNIHLIFLSCFTSDEDRDLITLDSENFEDVSEKFAKIYAILMTSAWNTVAIELNCHCHYA